MNIKKDEYEEFLKWKEMKAKSESICNTSLYEDIDQPMRKIVAMFALMKCTPIYSCCGFDYVGQPIHKCHQYGEPYIILKEDEHSSQLIGLYLLSPSNDLCNYWRLKKRSKQYLLMLNEDYKKSFNEHWRDIECPHYAEEIIIALSRMEMYLSATSEAMLDEAEIKDGNADNKEKNKNWQYPVKESFMVYKAKLDEY